MSFFTCLYSGSEASVGYHGSLEQGMNISELWKGLFSPDITKLLSCPEERQDMILTSVCLLEHR